MTTVSDWLFVFSLLYVGGVLCLCILPFFLYFRVKGIERALWAVVSQLRAARMEERGDLDPAATRRAREVAENTGRVALSMFGR